MSHCQLPPERLTRVTDLLEIAGRLSPSTAVLPGGHRVEDLRLVEAARDHGCVDRIILVGQKDRMAAAVKEAGIDVASDDMVAADGDEQIAAATIEVLKAGGVDIVLKGDIATPVMNRHILPLAVRPTVSLATVFDAAPIADGRPMLLTDAGVDGSVVLTFYCSEAEKDKMVRKVKRLSKVIQLEEHPYESQSLRKSALILCNRQLKPCEVVGKTAFLTSELVKNDVHGWTYLLAGSPSDLDPVLERLEADGIVKDVIYSVLSL